MTKSKRGVRLSITVAPQVSAMLDELLATGLFGFNRAHVAQGLLYRTLRSDDVRPFTSLAAAGTAVPRRTRR